ncbi:erythromycin esterase family protein [Arthrobacter crystallopoietes]|uniref:Erythromycin esterase homolog n=1 Tax=Crystallibacter crystallopoietes TaxID=37928 RepID=A0A1H1CJB0_9MICC|nr:erythromycin esterase family protein [Arthrobacter crystallopoietes]AUI50708.1 protein-L-isoaspartate O-methyltransferase [Arthrobacter crystallopoietes]SDQ64321.1 Erythromycin esterase homolog [Arthrobacter crystallopoietes]
MTDHSAQIQNQALPLSSEADLDPLLERIGDARYVLIGEASHGTHEYYAWRASLTRRLIQERGFSFVGVEGDWPDCYAVNNAVTLAPGAPEDPEEVLHGFDRWPTWMWANRDVSDFARWLRSFNESRPEDGRVGFYGLDVYSLWDSLRATLGFLEEYYPEHVDSALEAVRCFEPYAEDPQSYALSTRLVPSGCEPEVVELLGKLRTSAVSDTGAPRDARFNAEQNALSAAGAEAYYRAMVRGGSESWNVRDEHMVSTLDRLMAHHGDGAKAVVWEHNTHIGDARWTDMASAGMVNVGQLVREAHSEEGVVAVGFGSYRGGVIASDRWGGSTQVMQTPPARRGSVEDLMHSALDGTPSALFVFNDGSKAADSGTAGGPDWAGQSLEHRAIGVVYDPKAEQWGNYVPSVMGRRYDAFLFLDETTALDPLHGVHAHGGEMETWPANT